MSLNAKKVSTFQSRPLYRLQFPFVFRRLQSLQLLLSGSPLSSTFVSDFLWAVHSTIFIASFPLSDPLCFCFLSSASVLGSDYSASVLPFLLFPVPPHSCFPGARLRSRFRGFPFLSGLISRAFLPGSCTRLRCSFLFALPCFAPTAVPQVLTFRFHFRYFPLSVCFLSSALFKASSYSAFCFSFPSLPGSAQQLCFPGARFRFRFFGFPFLSGLISRAFLPGSCTWLRCSFPFALPCFAPTAVPQVLAFRFRFRHFPFPVRFLSSAHLPLPATQPLLFLSFSSRFRLTAAFPVPDSALAFSVSPLSPA